ncbi:MAG: signal peptidase II [Chloroflexi bacterium]|nr:signal peptidase II [Chloroflexota bacterium]
MPGSHKHRPWWHGLIFLVIAAAIVILDQVTKEWIRSHIVEGEFLPEMGCLTIVHVENTGSAFGLFTNQAFLLSMVAIAGLVVVLIFFRYLTELGFAGGIALSFIFGGALGNLIDRLRFGQVTDFIDVRLWDMVRWPAFNVADSAITVGAIMLGVIALVTFKKEDAATSSAGNKDI